MTQRFKHFFLVTAFLFASNICANSQDAAQINAKLGMAYLDKGYYTVAKDRLMTALQDDPRQAMTWYDMAYYLEKTHDPANAEKYYLKAISVEPNSGAAKNNYGTFLCRVGRYQEAIAEFNLATHERDYLYVSKAYENAGICALLMHNHTMAQHYFEKAIFNNPNMPFSLLSLARLHQQQGEAAIAQKYFESFKLLALQDQPAHIVRQYQDYVFNAPRNDQAKLAAVSTAVGASVLPTPG